MSGDAMTGSATRVALLARNGAASERLQAALREAGADVVLVCDPSETDVSRVRATGAQALLIALEPAVEESLDRFDVLLADPDVTVIFDEAELAAQRQGWDAARWTRHLAAKLNRHDQVLPPGAEIEAALAAEPEPLAVYQRPENVGDISAFAIEADNALADVPVDFAPPPPSGAASMFDPVLAEMDVTFDADAPLDFPGFTRPGPDESTGAAGTPELDTLPAFSESPADGADGSPLRASAQRDERFLGDLADLQLQTDGIELPGGASTHLAEGTESGAVVVLGGVGGPDAVRQFLSGLPAGFPRPIVIQQRLDGGQHEKLVRQMQRATTLPVHLAENDQALQPGHVYVLVPDMLPQAYEGELRFRPTIEERPAFVHLPPGDSAILMLSGSDPGAVDAAMAHAWGGSVVAGQSPEGCFDSAASDALLARGASQGSPADLARQLSLRWLSLE
jgi:chemosensory pili system protein ChpB (putative protein-glutamate methylesterase)